MENTLDNALKKFSEKIEKFNEEYNDIEKMRVKFLEKFPADNIFNMTLDDYVIGKGKTNESFCYWIETKLRKLGSINGGATSVQKFGVYYSKENYKYCTISKWSKDLDCEEALNNIKLNIAKLLVSGKNKNIKEISENPISTMFKNKIISIYYPEMYICICSEAHVKHFAEKLNIEYSKDTPVEEIRNLLLEYKNKDLKFKNMNNFMFQKLLYIWSEPKQSQVRILPMNQEEEFPDQTIKSVQDDFFMKNLISASGIYNYRNHGFDTPKGTLVLFQFNNCIIASAILNKVERFSTIKDNRYKGCFTFDVETIKVFEPILTTELHSIDENFNRFSQSKKYIDSNKREEIMSLINSRLTITYPDEINENSETKFQEGTKYKIIVNAYERNKKAREECLRSNGTRCAICGFDFGKFYGEMFDGKIHVHHIKPLEEIKENYFVEPKTDLIPVCPNCHMILHSKINGVYTVDEVKKFIQHQQKEQ